MSAETQRKVYFDTPKWSALLDYETKELVFEGPTDYCRKVAEYENWIIVKSPAKEGK